MTEEIKPIDAGGYTYYYNYVFSFKLTNGKRIQSYQELSGGSKQKTPDLSNPYPIEIVYLENNSEINKIIETLTSGRLRSKTEADQ